MICNVRAFRGNKSSQDFEISVSRVISGRGLINLIRSSRETEENAPSWTSLEDMSRHEEGPKRENCCYISRTILSVIVRTRGGGDISRYRASVRIDWLASAVVGKIFALEFITYDAAREGGGDKIRAKQLVPRVEVDLFRRSIFILASWRRAAPLASNCNTLTRENAYARFRHRKRHFLQ